MTSTHFPLSNIPPAGRGNIPVKEKMAKCLFSDLFRTIHFPIKSVNMNQNIDFQLRFSYGNPNNFTKLEILFSESLNNVTARIHTHPSIDEYF